MSKGFAKALVAHIREEFGGEGFIPLHAPQFGEYEREEILRALNAGYVSSVGPHVTQFEEAICQYTGARFAIATVNGTAALHICMLLAGVEPEDEVITQTITFVATCNAIRYCGAEPVLIDVERTTLGMCPDQLEQWLQTNARLSDDGVCINVRTKRKIRACVPMHDFGHPVRIEPIEKICREWGLVLVEDAAESLGSFYSGRHTGRFGQLSAMSFNGNKIITTGGGGMLLTDDEALASRAKHLVTTAKQPHPWLYMHDEVGYNYRLPALNAALGCAQMRRLPMYVTQKRALAARYAEWFSHTNYHFFQEPVGAKSNYWFNSFFTHDRNERDEILQHTNDTGVMTRPVWTPMHTLPLYANCQQSPMPVADWLNERLVNIPSSPRLL